ncbi:hypothetical protein CPB85DRAFT_1438743 [Mucidula mucida]|nr:hypothetical protein CPB85DRAFT_1438743 [Mucidula mucida]
MCTGGKAAIVLIKYASTAPPEDYQGAVLFNPGGPAASGVALLQFLGPYMAAIIAHSLFTAPSTCLQSYIRAYFENGTLPEESIICEVDATLFPSALNNGTFTEPHTMNVDTELFPAAP